MIDSKIGYYEKESPHFRVFEHIALRINEMENKSGYGLKLACKWKKVANDFLVNEFYPVVHPIG